MNESIKLGDGYWAFKENALLAYNDENNNFKPIDLNSTRASAATRVNKLGLIESVNTGVPRVDYLNNPKGSLLVEPQSTNLLLRSEEFNDAYWTKIGSTVTPNNAVSPDGTTTAEKLIEDTSNGLHSSARIGAIASAGTYTLSVYAKSAERTNIAIGNASSGHFAIFNVSLGTIVQSSQGTVTNGAISSVDANGYYRISCNITVASLSSISIGLVSTGTTTSYTGDGTSGIYIWGAQLEALPYATSYIPTVASTVTRVADVVSKTGISDLIGQTEGTIFVDAKLSILNASNQQILIISDGLSVNRIRILSASASRLRILYQLGGATAYDFVHTENYINVNSVKVAFTYKSGDIKTYINGSLVNASSNTYSISNPLIDLSILSNGIYKGLFNSLQLYKTALSDAELIALTQ
jgi:hypothetical protein